MATTHYRDHFGELNPRELVMFVGERAPIGLRDAAAASMA